MKKFGLLFSLVLLLTACDYESTIWIKNGSSIAIVVTVGYMQDTLLPQNPTNMKTININQSLFISGSNVDDRYLQRLEKGETLTIFVLNKDSVVRYSWEYIRENNVVFKKYELSDSDIKKDKKVNYVSIEVSD